MFWEEFLQCFFFRNRLRTAVDHMANRRRLPVVRGPQFDNSEKDI
jgi:hypothetical protein